MKICIYYKTVDRPFGGANSFIANLRRYFLATDVSITDDINSDYDILMLNSATRAPGKLFRYKEIANVRRYGYSSLFSLIRKKKRKIKIVYRLDGLRKIYAGIEHEMDDLQLKCFPLADHIVFQSEYSHEVFENIAFVGRNYSIIHNGVDQALFNMKQKSKWDGSSALKIMSCSWSRNPGKGHRMISEISRIGGVRVTFLGHWAEEVDRASVVLLGAQNHHRIAAEFKRAHIFLFPSLNEACSNTLIEALSCGLPVLYADSGGNGEIAEKYGVKLNEQDLPGNIEEIKSKYFQLLDGICEDIELFSIESVGRKYLEVCRALTDNG